MSQTKLEVTPGYEKPPGVGSRKSAKNTKLKELHTTCTPASLTQNSNCGLSRVSWLGSSREKKQGTL